MVVQRHQSVSYTGKKLSVPCPLRTSRSAFSQSRELRINNTVVQLAVNRKTLLCFAVQLCLAAFDALPVCLHSLVHPALVADHPHTWKSVVGVARNCRFSTV